MKYKYCREYIRIFMMLRYTLFHGEISIYEDSEICFNSHLSIPMSTLEFILNTKLVNH